MAITPYLLYEDVGEALKFLSKAFGFKKVESMKRPDGQTARWERSALSISRPAPGCRNTSAWLKHLVRDQGGLFPRASAIS